MINSYQVTMWTCISCGSSSYPENRISFRKVQVRGGRPWVSVLSLTPHLLVWSSFRMRSASCWAWAMLLMGVVVV
jgi:hypothetical protein